MPTVYKNEGAEVRSWASIIDENAITSALEIAKCPIVDGYLALMPDAHVGFGPPVGTALKLKGGIMPYAVGVDIGCGMIAVQLNIQREEVRGKEGLVMQYIRDFVPSGVGKANLEPPMEALWFMDDHGTPHGLEVEEVLDLLYQGKNRKTLTHGEKREKAEETLMMQFGTLGAGNHFAEVSQDEMGVVWLVVHSGSRGIGNMLATAHEKLAEPEGYFIEGSERFDNYIADMLWCQEYAFQQRELMMQTLVEAVVSQVPHGKEVKTINCHHNYAERLGHDRWLVRKGAINAEKGKLGVVPGSMGTATYIVRGLGNEEAYNTSPHGAGRLRSRGASRRELSVVDFKKMMEGKVWLDRDAVKLLDEAPDAYKDIEVVMEDSKSLVEPIAKLESFVNFKGL